MAGPVPTLVTFTTDYGLQDPYAAVLHGVVARLAPAVRTLDITHLIAPQDVAQGSAVLAEAVRWMPPAVHVAVVDPGVGTDRRAVAVAAGASWLVGPDNGLLPLAADVLGGVTGAWDIGEHPYRLEPVSPTFHGRDVFAPAAARLALGDDPATLGPAFDPETLVRLPVPRSDAHGDRFETEVVNVDHYGNVQLAGGAAALAPIGLQPGHPVAVASGVTTVTMHWGTTFGVVPAGGLLLLVDSGGRLAVAVNKGSAARRLGLSRGDRVVVTAAP
jgi:hypothetical protein